MQQDLWLIWELTRREVSQRYKGTFLGILWPVLYSILFLSVFSFVFSFMLKIRWASGGSDADMTHATLMIFCGMVPYLFMAEVMGRSPVFMLTAQNLVKKVRFPIHLIPVVNVNAAMLIALVNVVLLLAFAFATGGAVPIAIVYVALILIPLYLFALGLGWLFSAVAVFFRDLAQIAPVVVQILMFMAPVFYPASAVPEEFRAFFVLNPLTYFVEAFRAALEGQFSISGWLTVTMLHGGFAVLGRFVFDRLRPAFGDLL